jgi:hypothetical protein
LLYGIIVKKEEKNVYSGGLTRNMKMPKIIRITHKAPKSTLNPPKAPEPELVAVK